MIRKLTTIIFVLIAAVASYGRPAAKTDARTSVGAPDLSRIRTATTDVSSEFYYPSLVRKFQANDTLMTPEEFQYLYYGTLFQPGYDPYRKDPNPTLLNELRPIYAKEKRTRADRLKMLDYAEQVLRENPVDLRQLTNRIYVYEQNGKYDLAKIWQYKLNHLLLVIAASGNGNSPETAWTVVYPQHEYDFLNISGITVREQEFVEPHYDHLRGVRRNKSEIENFYFNVGEMLRQYFLSHPDEK